MNSSSPNQLSDALRWALDAMHYPAMTSADWLARDIDPDQPTAAAFMTNPAITLRQVKQAKSVFKTLRIVGETSAERRIGARMYVAAIAAGIVRFDTRVSSQSDRAVRKGLQALLDDRGMPMPLRDLAGSALCALNARAEGEQPPSDDRDDTLPMVDDDEK